MHFVKLLNNSLEDLIIMGTNYEKKFRRKISESLYMKEKRSSVNTQEKSTGTDVKFFCENS